MGQLSSYKSIVDGWEREGKRAHTSTHTHITHAGRHVRTPTQGIKVLDKKIVVAVIGHEIHRQIEG